MLVTLDSEGNIDLSGIARHDRYSAHVKKDGTIILSPLGEPTSVPTLDEARKKHAA